MRRMMMRDAVRFGLVGLSAVAFLGCGGGGGGSGPSVMPGQVSESGAQAVTAETASLVAALQAQDGESLTNSVMGLALSGPQQVVPGPAGTAAVIHSAVTEPGPSGGTVTCDTAGCVYDHYMDNQSGAGTFEINGSVKATTSGEVTTVTLDMTISADLSDAASGLNETINYDMNGSIA